jgi:hypothetical protein
MIAATTVAARRAVCGTRSNARKHGARAGRTGDDERCFAAMPEVHILRTGRPDLEAWMRSRIVRSLAAALIVVAGVIGYFWYQAPPPASPALLPAGATAPVATTNGEAPRPANASRTDAVRTASVLPSSYFDGVRDYAELAKKVAAAGNDADALYAKMIAAGTCDQPEELRDRWFARRKQREVVSPQAEASYRAARAHRLRFCETWDGTSFGAAVGEAVQVDSDSDLVTSQRLTEDEDRERATAMALEIFRTSHSGTAIRNAANYLMSVGADAWTDGKEVVAGSYLAKQSREIQWLAAHMVACDVGGGCGSDGFYAWSDCEMFDMCHPGVSMDEIWRRTNAPDVYEAARRMALLMRRPSG